MPQPLVLDPPVKGTGEWVNTSIYVFHPDERMQAGIKYTAKDSGGLARSHGRGAAKRCRVVIQTTNPFVVSMQPNDGETNVWIDRPVMVTFSQPMDHASAESAFSLHQGAADGPQVAGTFSWITSTVPMGVGAARTLGKLAAPVRGGQGAMLIGEMMVFTPTQLLERDTIVLRQSGRRASRAQAAACRRPSIISGRSRR